MFTTETTRSFSLNLGSWRLTLSRHKLQAVCPLANLYWPACPDWTLHDESPVGVLRVRPVTAGDVDRCEELQRDILGTLAAHTACGDSNARDMRETLLASWTHPQAKRYVVADSDAHKLYATFKQYTYSVPVTLLGG